jgi:hypothetical protein
MLISLTILFTTLSSIFRSRAALQLENLALRHGASAAGEEAPEIDTRGPAVVGLAVSNLA